MDDFQLASSSGGTRRFLDSIVAEFASTYKAEKCSLFLYDDDSSSLTLRAAHGYPMFGKATIVLQLGQGIVGRVIAERRPIYSEMASSVRGYIRHANFPDDDVQTCLGIPLLRGAERIGVLLLQRRTGQPFLAEEISAARVRAAELATAIQSARALLLAQKIGSALPAEKGPLAVSGQMIVRGQSVSNGFAIGPARVLRPPNLEDLLGSGEKTLPPAVRGLEEVLTIVENNLSALSRELDKRLPEAASMIFDADVMILHDENFTTQIRRAISDEGKALPEAIAKVVGEYIRLFESSDNDYLREKARDVEDLGLRLIEAATRESVEAADTGRAGSIVVADRLLPSDVLRLARDRIAGLVLCSGGATAHVTLLVRSLRIPMILAQNEDLLRLPDGEQIILDCANQTIYIHPDHAVRAKFEARFHEEASERPRIVRPAGGETRTADGEPIELKANINILADLDAALESGAEGIGLYRTEFPFLMRQSLPTENDQVAIYRRVLEAMPSNGVTFRTLDAGGDKVVPYLYKEHEDNPALGLRSIRLSLRYPYILDQQLRAILRTAQQLGRDDVSIMFPMISSLEEFRAAREHVETCLSGLKMELGDVQMREPFVGTMVEVPALVGVLDAIAEESDFFSIGTNDLAQYTLAVDRTNAAVAGNYIGHHPAILQVLDKISRTAIAHNIPCSVCGEAGRDPRYLPYLIGIGIRSFSLEPGQIAKTRELISRLTVPRCEQYAKDLLSRYTILDIEAKIDEFAREIFG